MKTEFLFEAGAFGSYKKMANNKSGVTDTVKKELNRAASIHVYADTAEKEYLDEFVDLVMNVNKMLHDSWKKIDTTDLFDRHISIDSVTEVAQEISRVLNITLHQAIKNIYLDPAYIISGAYKNTFVIPIYFGNTWGSWNTNIVKVIYEYMDSTLPNIEKLVIKKISDIGKKHGTRFFDVPSKVKFVVSTSLNGSATEHLNNGPRNGNHGLSNEIVERCMATSMSQDISRMPLVYEILTGSDGIGIHNLGHDDSSTWGYLMNLERDYLLTPPQFYISFVNLPFGVILSDKKVMSTLEGLLSDKNIHFISHEKSSWSRYESLEIRMDDLLGNYVHLNKLREILASYPNISKMTTTYNFTFANLTMVPQGSWLPREVSEYATIGKVIPAKTASAMGIDMEALGRNVYELDQNDPKECKKAADALLNAIVAAGLNVDKPVRAEIEAKLPAYLSDLMNKVVAAKPHCANANNKIMLCDYNKGGAKHYNIRMMANCADINYNLKKNTLSFKLALDFKLPAIGVNPNYVKGRNHQNTGKNYEYITGKKVRIDIKL